MLLRATLAALRAQLAEAQASVLQKPFTPRALAAKVRLPKPASAPANAPAVKPSSPAATPATPAQPAK